MATINFARKEIEAKVVYCGPALSGKTTNVRKLHEIVPELQRGTLHTLDTATDRTLFFDYVPIELGQIAGFSARFKLFTVPGQRMYAETRRVVLQGADAVVFVADSSPDRPGVNEEALADLEANLRANGLDLRTLPLVVQLNKRDVPGALPAEELARVLNHHGAPVVEAIAEDKRGVLETLYRVTEIAANRIRENLAGRSTTMRLTTIDRPEREREDDVVAEELERIREVRPAEEVRAEAAKRTESRKPDDLDQFLLEFVDRDGGEPTGEASPVTGNDFPMTTPVSDPRRIRPRPRRPRPSVPTSPIEPPVVVERPSAPALAPRPPLPGEGLPRGLGFVARVRVEALSGATFAEVLGMTPGPDGDPVFDVVLERAGTRTRHPMRVTTDATHGPRAPNLTPIVAVCLSVGAAVGFLLASLL